MKTLKKFTLHPSDTKVDVINCTVLPQFIRLNPEK